MTFPRPLIIPRNLATLQTAWSVDLAGSGSDTGVTSGIVPWVQIVPAAEMSVFGGPGVVVRFRAPTGSSYPIANAWIGLNALSGDAYDFDTGPVRLTFSGSNGVTISAGGTVDSDEVSFTSVAGRDVLVSWDNNPSSAQRIISGSPNNFLFGGASNDAATVNKSGYTGYRKYGGIDRIQVRA